MRIVRFAHCGALGVGVVVGDAVRRFGDEFASVAVAAANPLMAEASLASDEIPLGEVELLPPVDPDARVFAVAQNYSAHAREVSGTEAPPAPIIFLKPVTALAGAGAPIALPPVTSFLDYEAELAVMVGRPLQRANADDAAAAIFGVTCFNDVTGRDLQPAILGGKEVIDWFSAKSLDASSPVGPWIADLGSIGAPLDELGIRCRVNGETVQDDRTSSMVRSPAELLSFISHRTALRPGDLLATGTPGGVGRARGVNLVDGDVVEVEIDNVGTLRNVVEVAG